jgi:hypothetical protein
MDPVRIVTSFNKPETVQFGPIMKELNLLTVKKVSATFKADTIPFFEATSSEEYPLEMKYTKDDRFHEVGFHVLKDVLTCNYCTGRGNDNNHVAWCSHLHHLLSTQMDRIGVGSRKRFVIPAVPSEGIFCPVHIGDPVTTRSRQTFDIHPVHVVMGNRAGSPDDSDATEHRIIIGYTRSDFITMKLLRSMLLDWLMGNFDDPRYFASTTCQGPEHEKIKSDLSPFASRFYPSMYGLCPPCISAYQGVEADSSPDQDAPNF